MIRLSKVRLTAAARREVIERAATEVFAAHGYARASMEEIARRSDVSAPVLYDHFASKLELHGRLIERHLGEMREVWGEHLARAGSPEHRIHKAVDAWFGYVESHPFAWRMVFADTSGEPDVQAMHREIQAQSRRALIPLLAEIEGAEAVAGAPDEESLEMAVELLRSAIAGLALWWYDHRDIPRERVVAAVMNALWLGFERTGRGERWRDRGRFDVLEPP